ncbi:MAG: hypothetical protein QOH22_756 [Gemmatimonadaceae bacterium]|jgi:hypothetical protein|nr:hypothetical protein [Gemmatimonadaceae bacterium]MEA2765816.1 hypothetical protein [Gemmatimonadaceae bacterium]
MTPRLQGRGSGAIAAADEHSWDGDFAVMVLVSSQP